MAGGWGESPETAPDGHMSLAQWATDFLERGFAGGGSKHGLSKGEALHLTELLTDFKQFTDYRFENHFIQN